MRNEEHISRVKLARAAVIGFYRQGATAEEMVTLSGYNPVTVHHIIKSYTQARETGTPGHEPDQGDHFKKVNYQQ